MKFLCNINAVTMSSLLPSDDTPDVRKDRQQLLLHARVNRDSSIMGPLAREVEKWMLSLDLRMPVRRPKWDLANGLVVAEILSVYYPRKVL